jgi:hypothetical protein
LLEVGLVESSHVVDRGLTLQDLSRSNPVFLASIGNERRYVIKSGVEDRLPDNASGRRERQLYRLVSEMQELGEKVPMPRWIAEIGDLLVLAVVEPGDSLEDRQQRSGISAREARLMGTALGNWRRMSTGLSLDLPRDPPWVLSALGPGSPSFLEENLPASRVIAPLRSERSLVECFAHLKKGWNPVAVTHGDVRWNNALIGIDPRSGEERVVLIDWEFVSLGEPAWDVAGALAEALAFESLVERPEEERYEVPPETTLSTTVSAVGSYLAAFSSAYREAAGEECACADLELAPRLVAARLVQMALQHAVWEPDTGVASGLLLGGTAVALVYDPKPLSDWLSGKEHPGSGAADRPP